MLPEMLDCTKKGNPLEYSMEKRFDIIDANFKVLWEVINELTRKNERSNKKG